MDGFTVDTDALRACGNKITGLAAQAHDIKGACQDADVPGLAWGLLGRATTHSAYSDLLGAFQRHVNEIGDAVDKAGADITAAANNYDSVVQANVDLLTTVAQELGRLDQEIKQELASFSADFQVALRDAVEEEKSEEEGVVSHERPRPHPHRRRE